MYNDLKDIQRHNIYWTRKSHSVALRRHKYTTISAHNVSCAENQVTGRSAILFSPHRVPINVHIDYKVLLMMFADFLKQYNPSLELHSAEEGVTLGDSYGLSLEMLRYNFPFSDAIHKHRISVDINIHLVFSL